MAGRLENRRVLVTSCSDFMGPPVVDLFRAEGADLIADPGALLGAHEPTSCSSAPATSTC